MQTASMEDHYVTPQYLVNFNFIMRRDGLDHPKLNLLSIDRRLLLAPRGEQAKRGSGNSSNSRGRGHHQGNPRRRRRHHHGRGSATEGHQSGKEQTGHLQAGEFQQSDRVFVDVQQEVCSTAVSVSSTLQGENDSHEVALRCTLFTRCKLC